MNCLRINFILPNHCNLEFEKDKQLSLTLPEGELVFTPHESKHEDYTTYTFKSQSLLEAIALPSIKRLENALLLSFTNFDLGLLINSSLSFSGVTNEGITLFQTELGKPVDSEYLGVKVVDSETRFFSGSVTISSRVPGNDLFKGINQLLSSEIVIEERFKRAIELYNSTWYLAQVNNSGRFVLLMSAIECLIIPEDNPPEITQIIEEAQAKIKNLPLEQAIKNSVDGALNFQRKQGIKRSGKALIVSLFEGSDQTFNSLSPVRFFGEAYDLRSTLVHEGKTQTKVLTIDNTHMQQFAGEVLKKYAQKHYGFNVHR